MSKVDMTIKEKLEIIDELLVASFFMEIHGTNSKIITRNRLSEQNKKADNCNCRLKKQKYKYLQILHLTRD